MQLMVCIYYWLLFFKNENLKYTATTQRRSFNSFSLFYFFLSSFSFLLSLFKLSCIKKHHVHNLYRILHTSRFCYVMYYIISEKWIRGHFLEDCFYCYSQQIISVVAKESLIPNNFIQRAPKNTEPSKLWHRVTPQTKSKNVKYGSTNVSNENKCKIVCKMQRLKNGL